MRTFVGTDVELGAFGGRCIVHRRGARRHRDARPARAVGARPPQPAERAGRGGRRRAASASISTRVAAALASFHGAERRFERHGEVDGVLVVDDYGHHPTEIAAVMAAARATLDRRLVVAFQPHRYSRTAHLLDAFGPALPDADEIVLTDIYAAGEDPIPGVTVDRLAESIRTGSGRPVHVARSAGRRGVRRC